MATVTKLHAEEARMSAPFQCGECEAEFTFGPGFPSYCPECGEEFDKLEDVKP